MKLRNKKTGEITSTSGGDVDLFVLDEFNRIVHKTYSSLAELNEEWEDYAPKEPLIKDKNIRKAVRAWAKVNSIKEALYAEVLNRSLCVLTDMGKDDYCIEFVGWIPTLKDSESYTITELCGEEEQ